MQFEFNHSLQDAWTLEQIETATLGIKAFRPLDKLAKVVNKPQCELLKLEKIINRDRS